MSASPRTPGELKSVDVTDGDQNVSAQPNDVLEILIPNPANPKMVSNLDVASTGDAIVAGVANTSNPKGPYGGGRISIFVGLKDAAKSGTVTVSYKGQDGQDHKGTVTIQVAS